MPTATVTTIEFASTSVVGVSGVFISGMAPDSDAPIVIPELWDRLMTLVGRNLHEAKWAVGVMSDVDDGARMNYTAAIR